VQCFEQEMIIIYSFLIFFRDRLDPLCRVLEYSLHDLGIKLPVIYTIAITVGRSIPYSTIPGKKIIRKSLDLTARFLIRSRDLTTHITQWKGQT